MKLICKNRLGKMPSWLRSKVSAVDTSGGPARASGAGDCMLVRFLTAWAGAFHASPPKNVACPPLAKVDPEGLFLAKQ